VFIDAAEAGQIGGSQKHILLACKTLARGLMTVGIIALVDEATGYQEDRAKNALAEILEQFIAKGIATLDTHIPD